MQHDWKHVERPGGSHTALDGKKRSDGSEEDDVDVRGKFFVAMETSSSSDMD